MFDADKHCGVWIPETQRPCTRSLTCKVSYLTKHNVNNHAHKENRLVVHHFTCLLFSHFQTHALSLRRSVKGRSKIFDHLLREHRAAKEIMLKEKADKLGQPIASKSSSGTILTSPVTTVASTGLGSVVTSTQAVSALVSSPVMSKAATTVHPNKLTPLSPAQRIHPKPPLQKLLPSPHTRLVQRQL